MFTLGGILFILSGLIVYGSDRLFRKGKIKDMKALLIVKVSGLLVAVAGALFMFYGN